VNILTGARCWEEVAPYIDTALDDVSEYMRGISSLTLDPDSNLGQLFRERMRQRVIEGSELHEFELWQPGRSSSGLIEEAEEELLDAVIYFAIRAMLIGRKVKA
tara:strand:+ start:9386 stop:9697 length:312 start_codon:yes stop_codon:yes gene_type:complete